MVISELIKELRVLEAMRGDVEVHLTDGLGPIVDEVFWDEDRDGHTVVALY